MVLSAAQYKAFLWHAESLQSFETSQVLKITINKNNYVIVMTLMHVAKLCITHHAACMWKTQWILTNYAITEKKTN